MSFSPRTSLLPAAFVASSIAVALFGCAGKTTSPPDSSEARLSGSSASNACANKACGVDCTPPGSDEPFNCNAQGKCVYGGEQLGCGAPTTSPECAGKACGVDCTPAGSEEPFNCNAQGKCVYGGEQLGCKAKQCPEFLGDCIKGTAPADLDGDGCIDGCAPTK
jgi:hypothetical protein